jgi:pilus assembly protein CpaB
MNWKAYIPLAVAIVMGLLAARMAMNLVSGQPEVVQVATNLTPIVVAAGEIEPGTVLTEQHLRLGKVDAADVPAGAFTMPGQVVNKVVKVGLTPGQPILPSLLAAEGSGTGVSVMLPKGFRAITLEINDVSGVAGFIQPSCKVDVVGTIQADGKPLAKTILESIPVFAVGGRTGPAQPPQPGQPIEQARTITLLCTPEQAEKLELATSSTRIRLVLRNGQDTGTSDSDGITIAELKGHSRGDGSDPFGEAGPHNASDPTTRPSADPKGVHPVADVHQQPAKQPWTIEVIRGGVQSTQVFEIPVPPPAADVTAVTKPEVDPKAPQANVPASLEDLFTETNPGDLR